MNSVRTRFSPSPTGRLHIGNARTALFCALYATNQMGTFILRIEDTDVARSEERYVEALQEDLHWLGIDWQEGPGVDGEFGPYWQSQRRSIYEKYYAMMEAKKLIYPCFCSDEELNLKRKMQISKGEAPRYAGTCLKLSSAEVASRLAAHQKAAWRFIIPKDRSIEFIDTVKGTLSFQSNDIGDFVIRRADGTPPFLFSNAIDDATMEVSHVLRGEDHVANTPRQILLLKALNLHVPKYGHLSLIVGNDGTPLAKRHGSFSLEEMRTKGFLPVALLNYLARLGHTLDFNELASFTRIAESFSMAKLSRSPARFDLVQLLHWQKLAVQTLEIAEMWHWLGEKIQNQVPLDKQTVFLNTIRGNIEFPEDAKIWAKIFFHDNIEYDDLAAEILRDAGEQFFVEAELAVSKYPNDLPNVLAEMKNTLHVSGKKLFMPLRVALTGKINGPELALISEILGQKKMQHRLSHAFKLASKVGL